MTQRPCQSTGPISCPPRCGGSSPTTATRGVSGAVAGAPSPLSCSSRGSPTPHLLAPCGSISALFLVPRRDHLQPPLPPRDRPAPPSCPLHPPQHPPWPAEAQPCPPQPASTGPLTPGPAAPVLTQPPWALSLPPRFPLGLEPALIPPSGPCLRGCLSLTLGLGRPFCFICWDPKLLGRACPRCLHPGLARGLG